MLSSCFCQIDFSLSCLDNCSFSGEKRRRELVHWQDSHGILMLCRKNISTAGWSVTHSKSLPITSSTREKSISTQSWCARSSKSTCNPSWWRCAECLVNFCIISWHARSIPANSMSDIMWQLPQKATERRNNSSKGSLVRQLKFHDCKIKLHNLIKPSTEETTTTMTLLYWLRTADYLRSSVLLIWIFPILRALCSSTSRHFDIVFKKSFFLFNWSTTTTRVQWRQPEEKRV